MGRIANRLRRVFKRVLEDKIVSFAGIQEGERKAGSIESVEELIKAGHDPIHAVYSHTTNLVGLFAEEATALPSLHSAFNFMEKAQDEYMPGYPPMSPVTVSFYTSWTLFDLVFGPDRESIADCMAALAGPLELDATSVEALTNLRKSRLGVYKVVQKLSKHFRPGDLAQLGFQALNHEADGRTGFRQRAGLKMFGGWGSGGIRKSRSRCSRDGRMEPARSITRCFRITMSRSSNRWYCGTPATTTRARIKPRCDRRFPSSGRPFPTGVISTPT